MSYVVVAEFEVEAGRIDDFVALMTQHAEWSRAEPGCVQFTVNQDATETSRFLLFERYHDEAAYAAHRSTQHYARFRALAPPMLVTYEGEIFRRRSVLRTIA